MMKELSVDGKIFVGSSPVQSDVIAGLHRLPDSDNGSRCHKSYRRVELDERMLIAIAVQVYR